MTQIRLYAALATAGAAMGVGAGALISPPATAPTLVGPSVDAVSVAEPVADIRPTTLLGEPAIAYTYGPLCAVFAPGTPPEYMHKMAQKIAAEYGVDPLNYQPADAWPGSSGGQAVALDYSFPPDGISLGGNGNNQIFFRLNSLFGDEETWKALFASVFDDWSDVTGNIYTEVSDDGATWPNASGNAARGDVRIVMGNIDGPGGVLAFNFFPSSGGDMLMDAGEAWNSGAGSNFRFFRNTIAHEHGHGIGLAHSCPANGTKLMEPFINTGFDGPQLDDILGAQFIYGDRFEPNNTLGQATNLGALGLQSGQLLILGDLSLRNSSDGDLYRFEAGPAGAVVTVNVASQGSTYLAGPQNGDGSCQPGTPFAACDAADLQIQILGPSGTELVLVNNEPTCSIETLSEFSIFNPGSHYIRVSGAGPDSGVQQYSINVLVEIEAVFGDLNGDGVVGGPDLGILLGSWGPGPSVADLNEDGFVNGPDLALLLGAWTN